MGADPTIWAHAVDQIAGLLERRHIKVESLYYVGKESNYLEDVEFGLMHDPDEAQPKYLDPSEDP